MSTHLLLVLSLLAASPPGEKTSAPSAPDISTVPADLVTPPVVDGPPATGRRVRQVLPEYQGTQVYHALYLPTDWQKGRLYPVIVEYAGNGPYRNRFGDISTGKVEGSNLGYGISGGKGFLWVCLPYVNSQEKRNQTQWWGDVQATTDYCRKTVRWVCEDFGGDPSAVILTGFSRGAIACGYLGLHDEQTADVWLAFIPYSHYDGVIQWGYPGSDRPAALERLRRLKGRASFICHERSKEAGGTLEQIRKYLEGTGVQAPFTFQPGPFRNHNDAWVLRDVPERAALRQWLDQVLQTRPGTHSIRGRVADSRGAPLAGVRVQSGFTHWTTTDATGRYELRGLVDSQRELLVSKEAVHFEGAPRRVTLEGKDLEDVDFVAPGRGAVPSSLRENRDSPSGPRVD